MAAAPPKLPNLQRYRTRRPPGPPGHPAASQSPKPTESQDAHFQLVRRTATRQNKTAQNIFASSPPSTRQPWLFDSFDSLFDWFSLLLSLFFIYSLASFFYFPESFVSIRRPASLRLRRLPEPFSCSDSELSSLAAHPRAIAPTTNLESRRNPPNQANVLRSRDWQPFIATMDKAACRVVYVHRSVDKDGLVPAKPRRDATAAPETEQALAEITNPAINEDLKPLLDTFGQGMLPSLASSDGRRARLHDG